MAEVLQNRVYKTKAGVSNPVTFLSSFSCGISHARCMTMIGVHGVSHLMQCVQLPVFVPYNMQLAFLPASHTRMLGGSTEASKTISTERQHKTRQISRPVECTTLAKRASTVAGTLQLLRVTCDDMNAPRAVFTQRYCAHTATSMTYPADYVD